MIAAVDEAGVVGGERLVADPEAIHHAGPEVFENHVGRRGQAAQDRRAVGMGEVEAEAVLPAVLLGEVGGDRVHPRVGVTGEVALG